MRTSAQIIGQLSERFSDQIFASFADDKHPRIHIYAADWREIADYLKNNAQLSFDWLANLTGVDYVADSKMCVIYDLWSFDHQHQFAVKVYCDRDQPVIPSVTDIWPAANWHEREAFDLLGIVFTNHPDPRRILMADDWIGHPLKKDYIYPRSYHGIPGSVELDWQQKSDQKK